jgi:hypothetical protein
MDRLDRLEKSEELFKKVGIPYSIYNRGLYLELKEELAAAKKLKETLTDTTPTIVEETIIEEIVVEETIIEKIKIEATLI